jgi:hypothetical protein
MRVSGNPPERREKGGAAMALGDQIGEASGKITGTRVVTPVVTGAPAQMEVAFQGSGTLLGQQITDVGTYVQSVRPGGIIYGEGDVIWLTADGESAQWSGFGLGRPTGDFPAGHFAVCGTAMTDSEALSRLNEIASVTEYDVDEEGNYRWTAWEWR